MGTHLRLCSKSTAHVFVSIGLCEIVSVLKEKANHKKAYSVRVHVAFHVKTTWLEGAHVHICRLHLDLHVQKWDFNIMKKIV